MKRTLTTLYYSGTATSKNLYQLGKSHLGFFLKMASLALLLLLAVNGLHAQTVSGGWDAAGETGGATGYTNWGSGVIQLMNTTNTGCSGAAVHETTATYDPNGGTTFTKCYKVFFGCPGNDNIGSDGKGDGMAFSFWKNGQSYNINNGLACGGGLGYMGANSKMITIEFDTYSSQGNSGFDANYGGGTTGTNDEVAIHRDGIADDGGRLTSANAGNLEDGLEHQVCITYVPGTRILSVAIDGNTVLAYDLGATYNLQTYFGAGSLNQSWSSGKYGATNPATVSDGTGITSVVGTLCPSDVVITSPANGAIFTGCAVGPFDITATATPPAGNTVSYVEFFVDGTAPGNSIGIDNSATNGYGYSVTWGSPTTGAHTLYAIAHWSGGGTTTSVVSNVTVGGGLNLTSTAPTIDGTLEALWNSYAATALTKGNGASGNDLSATYRTMYDATNLYLYIDVTDDIANTSGGANWEKDGIEVYIDIGNSKEGCCGLTGNNYQYTFLYPGAGNNIAVGAIGNPGPTGGVTARKSDKVSPAPGYFMEIRFPWATLGGTPTAGTYIGFDVSINDDDNGGTRDNQLAWNDGSFGEWQNASLFGTLQFSNCNPLPVSLLTFTGDLSNGTSILNWLTTVEVNNKKFVVERSTDMTNWTAIGEVAGAGNSTGIIDYSFIDDKFPGGLVYYRLRQVDFDGTSSYSNIVQLEEVGSGVSISPNPFEDGFTIESSTKGLLEINIYDVIGRLLYQTSKENTSGSVYIQPELASGAYIVSVKADDEIKHQRVIKK